MKTKYKIGLAVALVAVAFTAWATQYRIISLVDGTAEGAQSGSLGFRGAVPAYLGSDADASYSNRFRTALKMDTAAFSLYWGFRMAAGTNTVTFTSATVEAGVAGTYTWDGTWEAGVFTNATTGLYITNDLADGGFELYDTDETTLYYTNTTLTGTWYPGEGDCCGIAIYPGNSTASGNVTIYPQTSIGGSNWTTMTGIALAAPGSDAWKFSTYVASNAAAYGFFRLNYVTNDNPFNAVTNFFLRATVRE